MLERDRLQGRGAVPAVEPVGELTWHQDKEGTLQSLL